MWKALKLKAFIKTYVLTGERLPMNWSKYQAEPKDKPNMWCPSWGVIREPLDGATVHTIFNRKLNSGGDSNLDYWSSITPEAAFFLSRQRDLDLLYLNGLTHLTDECADLLGRATGWVLSLNSLQTLSDSAAESLSRYDADGKSNFLEISLSSLKGISQAAARSLAKHNRSVLRLGLHSLPAEIATVLRDCKTEELYLDYLTEISPAAAELLGQREIQVRDDAPEATGRLSLGRVKTICPAAAAGLAHSKVGLNLGIQSISDEAMRQFSSFSGRSLSFARLDSLSENSAEVLAKLPCEISLGGLKALPESIARILVGNEHELSLVGLPEISEKSAEILADYKGESLALTGLQHLSDEAARRLVKYEGRFYIDLNFNCDWTPSSIPNSAASILAEHPTVSKRR